MKHGPHHGGLGGYIDELGLDGLDHKSVGGHRTHCRFGGSLKPNLWHGDTQRWPVRVTLKTHWSAHGRKSKVVGGEPGIGAVLTVGGDCHVYQAGIKLSHLVETQAQRSHFPRLGRFYKKVGFFHE